MNVRKFKGTGAAGKLRLVSAAAMALVIVFTTATAWACPGGRRALWREKSAVLPAEVTGVLVCPGRLREESRHVKFSVLEHNPDAAVPRSGRYACLEAHELARIIRSGSRFERARRDDEATSSTHHGVHDKEGICRPCSGCRGVDLVSGAAW